MKLQIHRTFYNSEKLNTSEVIVLYTVSIFTVNVTYVNNKTKQQNKDKSIVK